ncbi:hypothetical protein ACGYKD_11580 [Sulfitobacter sp. TB366]|uniref:hypothetical protein n=1 Tax=Sulfitobacter TaxID=60136 RepID=UPI0030DCC553
MADPLAYLHPAERREISRLAAQASTPPEALIAQFAAAFLRLAHEVPGALPRDPLLGPISKARGMVK